MGWGCSMRPRSRCMPRAGVAPPASSPGSGRWHAPTTSCRQLSVPGRSHFRATLTLSNALSPAPPDKEQATAVLQAGATVHVYVLLATNGLSARPGRRGAGCDWGRLVEGPPISSMHGLGAVHVASCLLWAAVLPLGHVKGACRKAHPPRLPTLTKVHGQGAALE